MSDTYDKDYPVGYDLEFDLAHVSVTINSIGDVTVIVQQDLKSLPINEDYPDDRDRPLMVKPRSNRVAADSYEHVILNPFINNIDREDWFNNG